MNIAYLGVSLALDQDRESGIELLFRVVEQLKLTGLHPTDTKELELQITAFDEFLVDLEVKNSEENYLLKKLNLILKNLGSSLIKHNVYTLFKKNKRLKSLITYLSSLRSIAIRSKEVTDIDIIDRSFEDFESSPYPGHMSTLKIKELWKKEHLSNIDDIERNEHFLHAVYTTYLHDFDLSLLDKKDYSLLTIYDLNKTDIQSIRIVDSYQAPIQHNEDLDWQLFIKTKTQSVSAFGYLLWTIGSALESINGVTTEIEDIGKGSIWTKIKLNFKDIVAKEETKEVLTKAKDAVISHYLEKPVVEVSKTQSEKSKIDSETELLKRELLNYDSPERKLIIDIDIESKKLDNRKRLADIESQELDNKMKRLNLIDTVAGLAAKGILSVDHVQIDINEVLFLLKDGSDISSGNDL